MSKPIRTFIALELEHSIQNFVKQIQNDLQNYAHEKITWVRPENSHITLKFIGNIDNKDIRSIVDALKNIKMPSSPLELTAQKIGAFSTQGIPKVLWIGFDDKNNIVQNLFEDVDLQLAALGMQCEAEKFQNHLTIGRIKFVINVQHLTELLKTYKISPDMKFRVTNLTLFKSALNAKGSEYESLYKIAM